MNEASNMAIKEGVIIGGDIYGGAGSVYTKTFGDMLTAFFSAVDDQFLISFLAWIGGGKNEEI